MYLNITVLYLHVMHSMHGIRIQLQAKRFQKPKHQTPEAERFIISLPRNQRGRTAWIVNIFFPLPQLDLKDSESAIPCNSPSKIEKPVVSTLSGQMHVEIKSQTLLRRAMSKNSCLTSHCTTARLDWFMPFELGMHAHMPYATLQVITVSVF